MKELNHYMKITHWLHVHAKRFESGTVFFRAYLRWRDYTEEDIYVRGFASVEAMMEVQRGLGGHIHEAMGRFAQWTEDSDRSSGREATA